jgi:PilZ domain
MIVNAETVQRSANERRRYPRFKVALPVEVRREGQSVGLRGETTDVSLSGFYYPLLMQLPVGRHSA